MAKESLPRANDACLPTARPTPPEAARPRANPVRYLVIVAIGAFAFPVVARLLELLGAPPAPAGASAGALVLLMAVTVLVDLDAGAPSEVGAASVATDAETRVDRA